MKPRENGTYSNMFVGEQPDMALFHCKLSSPASFDVSYRTPSTPLAPFTPFQQTTIEIPFEPATTDLKQVHIELHKTPEYPAYIMPDEYNKWFSGCFGYHVVLAYLGDGLGIVRKDEKAEHWISQMKPILPNSLDAITFSDGAALLVTSETSVADLDPRLPNGERVVHEKFRPNIVVEGAPAPWDEDFWAELEVPRSGSKIVLTSHCARCISINVDLEKGKMGEGESGKLLKKMMRDRRVDPGQKWIPIFGRYGFPVSAGELRVGDEIVVSRRNTEQTTWSKFIQLADSVWMLIKVDGYVPRLAKLENVTS